MVSTSGVTGGVTSGVIFVNFDTFLSKPALNAGLFDENHRSINGSINGSINRSINGSINGSINRLILTLF